MKRSQEHAKRTNKHKLTVRDEARLATKMLKDKRVKMVFRHRKNEVGIEFYDGTRLFIDHMPGGLDLSIT